jgi:hypothetical protein
MLIGPGAGSAQSKSYHAICGTGAGLIGLRLVSQLIQTLCSVIAGSLMPFFGDHDQERLCK